MELACPTRPECDQTAPRPFITPLSAQMRLCPWGNVLPGHPENQDQELQASQDSQALRLIPEWEQREGGEGAVEL